MAADHLSHEEYLDHARHNEQFLEHLLANVLPSNSRFADWAMVVIFYTALHYTKAALLRNHGRFSNAHRSHFDNHEQLHLGHTDLVGEYLPAIRSAYRELFDLGHEARYRGFYKLGGDAVSAVKRQRKMLENIKLACAPQEQD